MTDPMETRELAYFENDEEDADAIQEPGPASLGARDRPAVGRQVGAGDAERRFPARTREEAEASLDAIADFCENCPLRERCPEDECAVYRQEQAALAMTDDIPEAVAGVILPAGIR